MVVASRNVDKLGELETLLAALPLDVIGGEDAGVPPVEETGQTYLDNALLKAAAGFERAGGISLGDDSGLLVDALDGAPGVYSARFAGEGVTYADNNRHLIAQLRGVPDEDRSAAFVCTLALLVPAALVRTLEHGKDWGQVDHPEVPSGAALFAMEGRVEGRITTAPSGEAGFGYDPLFFYPPLGRTFAELTAEEKNAISHRGQAFASLARCLGALLEG